MKKLTIFAMSMGAGGAEKVISLFLKELIKDYEVTLFLFYDSIHHPIPDGVKIISLYPSSQNNWLRRLCSIPKGILAYARFLRKTRPDISLSFLYRPNVVSGILAPLFPHIRFIISERNYASIEYAREGVKGWAGRVLLRWAYNRADTLFSNSEHINKDLREHFHLTLPMSVIYNPIELPKERHNVSREYPTRIVSVGRFSPIKNHTLLFQALRHLPDHRLTIWGEGALRSEYERTLAELGISDRVSLPGNTKHVLDEIKQGELFVLSSISEGFPNVLLEAMSVGLPVIATNCLSGPLEMLNENEPIDIEQGGFALAKYGLMINVSDTKGLVSAVNYLSDHYEQRNFYSQKALERAEQYTLPSIYKQLKALIEEPI